MKYILLLSSIVFLLTLSGCEKYEQFYFEENTFTDVYFNKTLLTRTAVAEEGLSIKMGVNLGGMRDNTKERVIKYVLAPELLTGTLYKLLPADYYTISDPEKIVVPVGILQGLVTIKFDSLKFANDPLTLTKSYALPFRILSSSIASDSILAGQATTIIPLSYINTYDGNYYHIATVKVYRDIQLTSLDTTILIGNPKDYNASIARVLKTTSMNTVTTDYIGDYGGPTYKMNLQINNDNTVLIQPIVSSVFQVVPNGVSTWDPTTRKLHLLYKYSFNSKYYVLDDNLIFRNRIRDGINEWRWDGFAGN
jgi:hypothetical protein